MKNIIKLITVLSLTPFIAFGMEGEEGGKAELGTKASEVYKDKEPDFGPSESYLSGQLFYHPQSPNPKVWFTGSFIDEINTNLLFPMQEYLVSKTSKLTIKSAKMITKKKSLEAGFDIERFKSLSKQSDLSEKEKDELQTLYASQTEIDMAQDVIEKYERKIKKFTPKLEKVNAIPETIQHILKIIYHYPKAVELSFGYGGNTTEEAILDKMFPNRKKPTFLAPINANFEYNGTFNNYFEKEEDKKRILHAQGVDVSYAVIFKYLCEEIFFPLDGSKKEIKESYEGHAKLHFVLGDEGDKDNKSGKVSSKEAIKHFLLIIKYSSSQNMEDYLKEREKFTKIKSLIKTRDSLMKNLADFNADRVEAQGNEFKYKLSDYNLPEETTKNEGEKA